MAKKDDVLQANTGAPAANIPDLKKKEKERKKAGAAWSGARGAAGEFSGATGGNAARAAASAAGAAGEGAAGLVSAAESGGFFAGVARFFAGIAESLGMGEFWASITSTLLGRMAVAAAAFLMVAAAGILGYALMKGNGNTGLGTPNLGAIADSMRVRAGGDDRLGVNGNGELRFDPLSAVKPAPAAPTPPPADVKAADEKPAPDVKSDADAQKPVPSGLLAHNLSGAQLSSSLGGDFGSKNIFAGNSAAPKFGAGAATLKKISGVKGKLGSMKASTAKANPSAHSVNKASANKAFGQLRMAKGLSQQGAGSSTAEEAAASSQGAFDQQQQTGGALTTTGAPGGDTPPSLGGGAPDTSVGSTPSSPPGSYTDPGLQSALQQISDLANKAMQDMQTGTMLLIIGACLCATGWPPCVALGIALMAMGYMKIQQAKQEAAQAKAMGQQLAQQIGNQQQGNAINYCTDQAVSNGTPVSSCQPPDSVTNNTAQSAQDSADIQKVHQIPIGTANVISK